MRREAAFLLTMLAVASTGRVVTADAPVDDAETSFERKIRPTLAGTCFACHGGKKTNGGLKVDSREALIRGGEGGPALVPGDPAASRLLGALRHEGDLRMPPGGRVPDEVAADFAAWIASGAPWPRGAKAITGRHWAFEPVRPGVPEGPEPHPIDRFLGARLRAHGVAPLGPADGRTLVRRLTFDLTGLPPTPDEVAAFLADESPAAYDALVDRLLASPRYGERWGRHWLDVARYADTAGDNADYPVPEARLYRDYVIDAFNVDMPYDQFVREQLAGDILARAGPRDRYAESVTATGFLALSRRYATGPRELWHLTLEDAIETTGRAFLGLTLRCARCHDHKFDPVSQRDYYALYGVFSSTRFPYAGSEELHTKGFPRDSFAPRVPPEEASPLLEARDREVRPLRDEVRRIESETDEDRARQLADLSGQIDALARSLREMEPDEPQFKAVRERLIALKVQREEARLPLKARLDRRNAALAILLRPGLPAGVPGAYAVGEGDAVDEAVQVGGDPGRRGPVVPRGVPHLPGAPESPLVPAGTSGRLELARWLTRPEHPLTARVMVNRIWQGHFGRGLVATPSNFGVRGDEPTHPELLDWLAARFIDSGWSVKAMHRLIVTSAAYRRASGDDPSATAKDPANRWYWRFDRRRLEAEAIRDAMLAVSGRLDGGRPGPHPFPPIEQWSWTQHAPFKAVYPSDHRSVYLMTQRLQRHPFLGLFDGPDTNYSTDVRARSIVPLQALYLMNNPDVRDLAEGLGRRIRAASPDGPRRVALAHELVWGRPPEAGEAAAAFDYIARASRELARAGATPERAEAEAWDSYARVLLMSTEFVYID